MTSAYCTQAAVLFQPSQPLRLIDLAVPELKPGQVLVDLAYSGVCHTQLLEAQGQRGPDRYLPHTMGHEGSGTVVSIGPGVMKVKPGEPVVLSWIKGEGAEVPSTIYGSAHGPVNSGAVSTFMTRTVVSENRVTPIPKDMPLREAAVLGCAVPTGAGIVLNTARASAGSSLAVFGVGGIGLSAVLAASMVQVYPIIAVDVYEHKLLQAKTLGATHTVNAKEQDPVKEILGLTGGLGVDYALECAGQKVTMEAALQVVRTNGGLCVLAGNLPYGQRIEIDPFDLIRGKRIIGTWGGESQPDRDIPRYVSEYLNGKLRLQLLITHEYQLGDVNRALDDLAHGNVGRALLHISQ